MSKHQNYNKEELTECSSCELCSPEEYRTEVDIRFLKTMREMFESLCEVSPGHTAPGWLIEINNKIKECKK